MKTRAVIIIITFVFIFFGCGTNPCHNTYISPVFIGFSAADIDTLIIRKYQKNDNFLHLLDTTVMTKDNAYYYVSHDTTIVLLNPVSGHDKYLLPDNDWQIYLPGKAKTIIISNIVSPQTEACFKCGCSNPINSFDLNGQPVAPRLGTIAYTGSGYNLVDIHY